MVVMETSSFNDVDANAMTESAFGRLAEEVGGDPARPESVEGAHERAGDVQVRFAAAAWRDHVVALATNFLGDLENGRIQYACTGIRRVAELGENTQRYNLVLMDGAGRGTWMEKMRLRLVVSPGTEMMSQFVPWFFGVAFPFCFKFGTGMPDMPEWSATSRHRRGPDAPRVELPLWTRIMTRRVESQLRRDWRFGFTMSSLLYQSALNMSKSMRLFTDHEQVEDEGDRDFSYMEEAAVSIVEALRGSYVRAWNRAASGGKWRC